MQKMRRTVVFYVSFRFCKDECLWLYRPPFSLFLESRGHNGALSKTFLFFPFQEHGEFFHNIYQCYSPCLLARSTGFFSLACKRCRPNGAGRKRYVRRIIIYCDGALLLLCAHLIFSSTLFFLFFQSFPFIRPPSFGREGGGGMRASAVPLYM